MYVINFGKAFLHSFASRPLLKLNVLAENITSVMNCMYIPTDKEREVTRTRRYIVRSFSITLYDVIKYLNSLRSFDHKPI
jgi:hypothetical protein